MLVIRGEMVYTATAQLKHVIWSIETYTVLGGQIRRQILALQHLLQCVYEIFPAIAEIWWSFL